MKISHITALCCLLLMGTGAFAQTPSTPSQAAGPGVHKANIAPAPQGVLQVKQAKKEAKKAELAKMTPEERTAFKADRKAKKDAKLAAMTPEQRQAHDARKAEKKASKLKGK